MLRNGRIVAGLVILAIAAAAGLLLWPGSDGDNSSTSAPRGGDLLDAPDPRLAASRGSLRARSGNVVVGKRLPVMGNGPGYYIVAAPDGTPLKLRHRPVALVSSVDVVGSFALATFVGERVGSTIYVTKLSFSHGRG